MKIACYLFFIIVGAFVGSPANANRICRPSIKIMSHELGNPTNLRRVWIAHISVDASACASSRGLFSLRIVRSAENAPDHEFEEPLLWKLRQRTLALEFWIDEAVQSAKIADIADCPCRER